MFLLCGLWHGAHWNFVFWGLYYGVFLAMELIAGQTLLAIAGVLPAFGSTPLRPDGRIGSG